MLAVSGAAWGLRLQQFPLRASGPPAIATFPVVGIV